MEIINLTQYLATQPQIDAGVFEPSERNKQDVNTFLTFEELPETQEIHERAVELAHIAELEVAEAAMIGGAPYLMGPLTVALNSRGIQPQFAFSRRESVEETQEDGSVVKLTEARHLGFVQG